MRILICNERFLFRYGVDRVLLILGSYWKKSGHEIIMMGNKLDSTAVEKCSDRFIRIPEAPDYLHGNDYTLQYLTDNWGEWFDEENLPDIALIAGWPFYNCIKFLREHCGTAIFHDYGAVPMEGMSEPQMITQSELRRLRRVNLRYASRVVAISNFLEESQSKKDLEDVGHDVPTAYVHLGVDHLDMHLWNKGELSLIENDVVKDIKKFKEEGYKIIFQPGRWESGNYKNSSASVELVQKLVKRNIKHKILVLSELDALEDISDEAKESYYGLGYIDDDTMRIAMEMSDVGISPTLWEGFDLPLGEMQYLNKPMFVLNIGAHPEVASNSYFLCKDMEELADKVITTLTDGLPFTEERFLEDCNLFREKFTWEKSSNELLKYLEITIKESKAVFLDVTNACHDTANSGVMRVTRKIAHYLQNMVNTVFIMWDDSKKKYVFPYEGEIDLLCSYGGPDKESIVYRSKNGQARELLDNVIGEFRCSKMIHLFTETVNYKIMKYATDYFHSKGIAVAAIFYDAIAVYRPELCAKDVSDNHSKYMCELSNCDVVMPIAEHNGADLKRFWDENGVGHTKVVSVGLAAEMSGVKRETTKIKYTSDITKILFVSTLEPRKNHIRFLKGLEKLFAAHPELKNKIVVHLVGNRYVGNDEIPDFVGNFCEKYTNVKWLGVVDDEILKNEYKECTFTVYPSEIEGFGMPIIESLWFGKPCLCNKDGSIGELAGKGGCCLTDVLSEQAMADSLYKLIIDRNYYLKLQSEAVERNITTWSEYVNNICDVIFESSYNKKTYRNCKIFVKARLKLKEYFNGWNGRKVIVVSNFYPPDFVGGAEIIAHNQAKTMISQKLARVVVFSIDMLYENIVGTTTLDEYEGVPTVKVAMDGTNFCTDGINFYNECINEVFDELCCVVNPDIVHCHNIIGMSLGIIDIAKKYDSKVCVTLHDNWGFCYKNTMLDNRGELCSNIFECENCMHALTYGNINIPIGVRKNYFRRTFEKIDAYVSPSKYLAEMYIRAGFDFHKMNVLWNGIDVNKFKKSKKIDSDKIRITVAAYFGKHKGIGTLIKAVGLLNRSDIEINLIGTGEEQENYKEIAAEVGVLHQLRFWGKLANEDIQNAYAETDIYCLPSIWPENQPVSITEAMASALPVITSSIGGGKELVIDGVTGYTYEPGNVQELAEKIKQLAENEPLRKKFGNAGLAAMSENSYENQVTKLCKIYDDIVPEELSSKKIIAVKGYKIPNGIDCVTDKDVLIWDWIDFETEVKDVVACLVIDSENLSKKDIQLLKENNIIVLCQEERYQSMKAYGLKLAPFKDIIDALRVVST